MLSAIKKIDGLGVFSKYAPAKDLVDFERFNVIFGENGSGKTTLSRLFAALEAGAHPDHPELQYSLQCQVGTITQGRAYPRKIRVFNADFVEANVGRCEGHIPHILIIGEENKKLAEELAAEEAALETREEAIGAGEAAVAKLENDRGKLFSGIAKTIGEATSGTTLRSYRKPDAEAAYTKLASFALLEEKELERHRSTVHQDQMEAVDVFALPREPKSDGSWRNLNEIVEIVFSEVGKTTLRTAQTAAINRLAENPDIDQWAEAGLHLHRKHNSARCEFCDQSLPPARLAALAAHFSDEDQELKKAIENDLKYLDVVREYLKGMTPPSKLSLYSELREEADTLAAAFEAERTRLVGKLDEAARALTTKVGLRTTSYDTQITPELAGFLEAVSKLASLTIRHNEKCAAFDTEKSLARTALESHYLSSISVQVSDLDKQIKEREDLLRKLQDGEQEERADGLEKFSLEDLQKSIAEKRARIANAHIAGADLTKKLRSFLGRDELTFESTDSGYLVHRRGKPAKRLSEGEKTAIAFVYFIVRLSDQSFNLNEGVVVVDDPISSLDSTSIYQAFSYMKNAVKDAKQVFILTHNFDFLKLVLNWFHRLPKKVGGKAYFMIVCTEDATGRSAKICKLDQLLKDHPSEYQYLFKQLYNYKSDGTIESAYHIPNIARKVLETFLEFHVPSNKQLYDKLEATGFDPLKRTAIYKFANDLSHMTGKGFDPALVSEAQKNTRYLLELIEAIAPQHYAGLVALSS